MIQTIQAEFCKYKRSKLWLFILTATLAYILLVFLSLPDKNSPYPLDYRYIYFDAFPLILITHIIILGLFISFIFNNEYSNRTMNQIKTIPVPMHQHLMAKYVLTITFSLLCMLISGTAVTIAGFLRQAEALTSINILSILALFLTDALTISLAMAPIFFLTIFTRGNYLLSILGSFIYAMIIILPSMAIITIKEALFMYLTPLGNMGIIHNKLQYHLFSADIETFIDPDTNIFIGGAALILFLIIFTILSHQTLKKQ